MCCGKGSSWLARDCACERVSLCILPSHWGGYKLSPLLVFSIGGESERGGGIPIILFDSWEPGQQGNGVPQCNCKNKQHVSVWRGVGGPAHHILELSMYTCSDTCTTDACKPLTGLVHVCQAFKSSLFLTHTYIMTSTASLCLDLSHFLPVVLSVLVEKV